MPCSLCDRVKIMKEGKYPFLIHEFENSYLQLGEHQFFRGYSLLVLKEHCKEMTDLPAVKRARVFEEMMLAHEALEKVFRPQKMNLCSLGNVVPHVHWHFFPRYADDPDFSKPPWLQMDHFDSAKVTPEEAKKVIAEIRMHLPKSGSHSSI